MVLLEVSVLLVLLAIVAQDFNSRSVYLLLFPVLLVLLILLKGFAHLLSSETFTTVLINLGFLVLQLALLTVYFSVKRRSFVNITTELLGWGDILLLVCIAFYLSVLNFLFFYLSSLLLALIGWVLYTTLTGKKDQHIPLAGLQGIILFIYLAGDWFFKGVDLTNDAWLLHFIT